MKKLVLLLPFITLSLIAASEKTLLLINAKKTVSSLSTTFLQKMIHLFEVDTFIETGTFYGETTEIVRQFFDKVHTIELSKSLYDRAVHRFRLHENVRVHLGDSPTVLQVILPLFKDDRVLFWLDSHGCGGGVRGEKMTPILEELDMIKQSGKKDGIILVDDVCCFQGCKDLESDSEGYGFPTITQVKEKILEIDPTYIITQFGDLLLAWPATYDVRPSDFMQACLTSRCFDNDENISLEAVMRAEQIIAQDKNNEQPAIESLASWRRQWAGIYYNFWNGLMYLHKKEYPKAYNSLNKSLLNGFGHWRVYYYLAEVCQGLNKADQARNFLNYVLIKDSEFAPAKELLAQMQ